MSNIDIKCPKGHTETFTVVSTNNVQHIQTTGKLVSIDIIADLVCDKCGAKFSHKYTENAAQAKSNLEKFMAPPSSIYSG